MRVLYYDEMLSFLGITPLELGQVLAIYGISSTCGTFFSGILADKYPHKWLLVFSLAATGLGGLYFLTKPSYHGFLILYIFWGLSITFTYNSAYYKSVRYTGSASQQGKLFGSINGGRKLLAWLVALAGTGLFALYVSESRIEAFKNTVLFYSIIYLVIAVLVAIFWKKEEPVADDDKWKVSDFLAVLKHPATWLLGFTIYGVYSINRCMDMVTPYMTNVLEMEPATSAFLNGVRFYAFPFIAGMLIGYLMDKFTNKIRVIQVVTIIGSLTLFGLIFLPTQGSFWHIVFFSLVGVSVITIWGTYATAFSLLETANIPKKITGSIIGVAISIGYLPDISVNYLNNYLADAYGYELGSQYIFTLGTAHGIFAIIVMWLFGRYLAKINR